MENIQFTVVLRYKAAHANSPANYGSKMKNGYPAAGKISGTNEAAQTANHTIQTIREKLLHTRADLQSQNKPITAELAVNTHLGKTSPTTP